MPDLNVIPAPSDTRNPRGAVKLGGKLVTGWTSFEVDNNAYRSADTFSVTFVASDLPKEFNVNWFSQQTAIECELFANANPPDPDKYEPSASDSLVFGNVDEVAYDPVAGTVEVSGRDLTALLIDTKTTEHFSNQKSSEIATELAKRHGLTPVVTATSDIVGEYYNYDRVTLTQEQSEWEILSYLANVEDYALYVKGKELHFHPRENKSGDHYAIQWQAPNDDRGYFQANIVTMSMTRNLTIAKGVSVEVRSWNVKKKGKPVIATFPKNAVGVKAGQAKAQTQVYKRFIPNLTHEEALKRAEAMYRHIILHEKRMTFYAPADNILDATKTIQVRGTDSDFDQVYYLESLKRSMSVTEGYRMTGTAKNTSPELEAAT